MTMIRIRPSRPADAGELFRIWSEAVRATHHFLSEPDYAFFAGQVWDEYLPLASFRVAVDGQDRPVGFMGMTGSKIDSLFVDPAWQGNGIGKALVEEALRHEGPVLVDVNEQNSGAREFYRKLGFREVARSPVDGSGRPYPLTHLSIEPRSEILNSPLVAPALPIP
jgi:putative acetyltransferase